MNLDELQSVQSRERQATSLQNLRSSFYRDAGEFIQDLERERDRAAERADDPFSSPEVRRLTDDIETAKQTVEALYERRVGKVVKMASIAAADMPTEEDGLTEEESALFESLVDRIEDNRTHVLDEVLEGESSDLPSSRADIDVGDDTDESDTGMDDSNEPPPEAEPPETDGVSAADLMGSGPDEGQSPPAPDTDDPASPPDAAAEPSSPTSPSKESSPDGSDAEESEPSPDDESTVERTTVRITQDVGEIFGIDERSYDLGTEDVVALPTANAEPLLQRDAAEKLE